MYTCTHIQNSAQTSRLSTFLSLDMISRLRTDIQLLIQAHIFDRIIRSHRNDNTYFHRHIFKQWLPIYRGQLNREQGVAATDRKQEWMWGYITNHTAHHFPEILQGGEVRRTSLQICQQILWSFLKPLWQTKSVLHMNFLVTSCCGKITNYHMLWTFGLHAVWNFQLLSVWLLKVQCSGQY